MRGQSTLPMDSVDVALLSDIITHFLGSDRDSATAIRNAESTIENGHNPSFENDVADSIIDDLSRVVDRAPSDMMVSDCTEYSPSSDAEADFLDLTVKGYVKMRRDYFEECHDPYR